MKQAKIKTFVGEVHFATALACHIMHDYYDVQNPASLANLTVMLPTRRACQSLKMQLFQQCNNLILPRLTTISDLNLLDFIPITHQFWQQPPQKIIPKQTRLFMLARYLFDLNNTEPQLFNSHLNFANLSFAGALEYAESFLALRDDFLRAKIGLPELNAAIIGDYATHWLKSLELFQRTMQWLDAYLVENKSVEAITQAQTITDVLCEYWQQNPYPHPIIAAGSTGSATNTSKLLQAIHAQPYGCLILRELDIWSDDADFNHVPLTSAPTSASYNLRMLLQKLGATRNDVVHFQENDNKRVADNKRGLAASIMLHSRNKLHDASLNEADLHGIEWLECEDEISEAQAICVKVRHVLSERALSKRRANIIIISDDDALNMRLKTMLAVANIQVDISAGIAAHHHPQFNFMLLVAQTLYGEYNSANLLSLMRHKICAIPNGSGQNESGQHEFGQNESGQHESMMKLANLIEAKMLRSMHPYRNLHEVLQAVIALKLSEELQPAQATLKAIADLVQNITTKMPLKRMIELHQAILLALLEPLSPNLNTSLNPNIATLLAQNLQLVGDDVICANSEYLSILQQQCAAIREVSPPVAAHVTIIGALELRLQVADLLIIPRMNEGVFPSSPPPDPWLNNELRRILGLNYFERKIGLAAHDMAIMLRFEHVLFTRACKESGAHTRSSRLFERLKLLLQKHDISQAIYLSDWADELMRTKYCPAAPPAINPPLEMRPRRISATTCEALFENPFKVYVSHILRLKELEPLDDELQAKHFGQILHAAVHEAAGYYNNADYLQKLGELFAANLQSLVPPAQAQFYQAKLQRILSGYYCEEGLRYGGIERLETEAKYAIPFVLKGGVTVELNARIDRIEWLKNGKINVVDHKTGNIPSAKQIDSFEKCQLLVAQLIMERQSEAVRVEALEYWEANGKQMENVSIANPVKSMDSLDIAAKLYDMLSYFLCDEKAIYHYNAPQSSGRSGSVDHLARLGEYY